ncbi:MAG: DNA-processing protein DprA [Christensenellaceae bacterium]|jgi:DNA processing protein|nr:DNA-processing protein DprA [Christensenellaceae bacterium]
MSKQSKENLILLYLASKVVLPRVALAALRHNGVSAVLESLNTEEGIRNAEKVLGKTLTAKLTELKDVTDNEVFSLATEYVERGVTVIFEGEEKYPENLYDLSDYPIILYCAGNIELLSQPSISVIGTRMPTKYGLFVGEKYGRTFAQSGIVVVSGLAAGIDGSAHTGANEANGKTIGVLGAGIDIVYPVKNYTLFKQLKETGLLISEYPPGTPPDRYRFPERNRIIAALSEATVVIECGKNSGTLSTVKVAHRLNRGVYSVPHEIISESGIGGNTLILKGDAKITLSPQDVLDDLNLTVFTNEKRRESYPFDSDEARVTAYLQKGKAHYYDLVSNTGIPPAMLNTLLMKIECDGVIAKLDAGYYCLV